MIYSFEFLAISVLSLFLIANIIYYAYMWRSHLKKEKNQSVEVASLNLPLISEDSKKSMISVIKFIFLDAAMFIALFSDLGQLYIIIIFILLFIYVGWTVYDIFTYTRKKRKSVEIQLDSTIEIESKEMETIR